MSKEQEFTQKLALLLKEYQASISFECSEGSDHHGIYNPQIVASIDNKDFTLSFGYSCYSVDIIEETDSDDEE